MTSVWDKVKPGDRVHVSGIYRALSSISGGSTTGVFRVVILANSVRVIGKEVQALVMTLDDIKNIKKIAERKDVVDLLGRSVAPSIYGHEYIKKVSFLFIVGLSIGFMTRVRVVFFLFFDESEITKHVICIMYF